MLRLVAPRHPYPADLGAPRFAARQILFNQAFAMLGLLGMQGADMLSPIKPALHSWLYLFVWVELMNGFGLSINGSGMLWAMRYAWRRKPDAPASYERDGLFTSLPAAAWGRMLWVFVAFPPFSAWLTHQTFLAVLATDWGMTKLDHTTPIYTTTLFNIYAGLALSCVFEYLHDRWRVHADRARLARKLTTEAQLQLLRSQLDPHMLFNTLSNLYELIDTSPKQARAMLLHLIGFLRSTLDGSQATQHALADEFNLASDYVSLMQIRMGQRLRATLDLPDALRAVPVPAMLLQPVIENAIKHGLETRKQGGDLSVAAFEDAGQLVLRVRNSGINKEAASEHPGMPPRKAGGGFGLRSVKDRLDMLCGPGDHVELVHLHAEDLTQVTVRLPITAMESRA